MSWNSASCKHTTATIVDTIVVKVVRMLFLLPTHLLLHKQSTLLLDTDIATHTLVSSLMTPSNKGYFSLATIGASSSMALSEGTAGARRVKRSSAA